MIVIKTMDGHEMDRDENAVDLIAGPYPHDVGPTLTSTASRRPF
jgi:hypothetical protein